MALTIAFFVVAAVPSITGQGIFQIDEQLPIGSPDFNYFNEEAEKTSKQLQTLVTDVEDSLFEYVEHIKISNNMTLDLNKYYEVLNSTRGSSCTVSKDELSGAQDTIVAIIAACMSAVPPKNMESLKGNITEAVGKVRAVDNDIRQNSYVCSSLRAPPFPSCVEAKAELLEQIKNIVSSGEMAKFNYYSRLAFLDAKEAIDSCVEKDTKNLKDTLETQTKHIEECKASL